MLLAPVQHDAAWQRQEVERVARAKEALRPGFGGPAGFASQSGKVQYNARICRRKLFLEGFAAVYTSECIFR